MMNEAIANNQGQPSFRDYHLQHKAKDCLPRKATNPWPE
jgi:hypothetical protein